MTGSDTAWMRDAACAAPEHRRLPWLDDANSLPTVLVEVMRDVCAGCLASTDCTSYVEAAGIVGGFWAGADRDPHPHARPAVQLTVDELLEPAELGGAA